MDAFGVHVGVSDEDLQWTSIHAGLSEPLYHMDPHNLSNQHLESHSYTHHNLHDHHGHHHSSQPGSFEPVLSAPLLSSPAFSQHEHDQSIDQEDHHSHHHLSHHQHHQIPFHHLSSAGSPGMLPSVPPTPPLSSSSSVVGGSIAQTSSNGNSLQSLNPHLHHHHQFPTQIQPHPQRGFKRPYQPENTVPGHMQSAPQQLPPAPKRRKSTSAIPSSTSTIPSNPKSPKQPQITDDDSLLLRLKDEENLPWKLIQKRFLDLSRGEFKVPTLQMRYKRLKEKMRVWEIDDVGYLKEAREVVVKEFWELVSKKMVELGCKKKIPGVACERKWREIDTTGGVSGSDGKNGSQQITSPKMMQEEIGSPLSMAVRSRSPKSEHKGMMCMAGTPGSMVDVKRERELGTLSEGEEE